MTYARHTAPESPKGRDSTVKTSPHSHGRPGENVYPTTTDFSPDDGHPGVELGALVRMHRRRLGLSQEALAERGNLSVRTITDLERGRVRRPHRYTVAVLADSFALHGPDRAAFEDAARLGYAAPVAPRSGGRLGSGRERHADPLPRELPRAPVPFVGREDEMTELSRLESCTPPGGAGPVSVITGLPGVGKTALAIRFAHDVSRRYDEGQFYINLHGSDPSRPPLTAGEVLGRLLRATGFGDEIPGELDERAALFRSATAGRRIFVLLDDAMTADQVRPALTAGDSCLTLVTSRSPLDCLVALEGVHRMALEPLDEDAAVALLAGMLGATCPVSGSEALADLARRCGRLPLALRLTAVRLTGQARGELTAPTAGGDGSARQEMRPPAGSLRGRL